MPNEDIVCKATGCNFGARTWLVSRDGKSITLDRCERCAARLRTQGYEVKVPGNRRKWDLTSTHSLESAAEYLRKNAEATLVLVIRAHDSAVAVNDGIEAEDVKTLIDAVLYEAVERLDARQQASRAKDVAKRIRDGVNPEEARYA